MNLLRLIAIGFFSINASGWALAADISTGEVDGAYNQKFCKTLQSAITSETIQINCIPSKGSLDNLNRSLKTPSLFGFSQYDIYSSYLSTETAKSPLKLVRDDIGRECLFLVTKNKLFNNYGDISASAAYLNFILPPEKSGHAATFKLLQKLDPDGLAKAARVSYAASAEDAITSALSSKDGVTLIVQFADPNSNNFKVINANGGHFIPAISREILGREINGKKIYAAEETPVTNPKWHQSGKQVITSCTPLVLFTGQTELIDDENKRAAHKHAISKIEQIPASKLKPKQSWYSWLLTGSKSLSAKGIESMLEATDKAKKAASPYVKKAKDASQPYVEKAKESTKEMIDAATPTYEAAKEKTKKAIEAAKPTYEAAKEKAKEIGKKAIDKAGDAYKAIKEKTDEQMQNEGAP